MERLVRLAAQPPILWVASVGYIYLFEVHFDEMSQWMNYHQIKLFMIVPALLSYIAILFIFIGPWIWSAKLNNLEMINKYLTEKNAFLEAELKAANSKLNALRAAQP